MSPDDGTVFPPEPPPEFVAFVARTLPGARTAAGRLTGADRYADEVYPEAFADVATGWPWRRLVDVDRLLDRRLRTRAAHWRQQQIYPVEVLREARPAVTRWVSIALRKAGLLPSTARREWIPAAEAAIAWAVAYRRHRWMRWTRIALTTLIVLVVAAQLLPTPPT